MKRIHNCRKTILGASIFSVMLVMSSCGGGGNSAITPESGFQPRSLAPALRTGEITEAPVLLDVADESSEASSNLNTGVEDSAATSDGRAALKLSTDVPPAGASGGPSINTYYKPSNAFDGNYSTWWVGARQPDHWELIYGFSRAYDLDAVNINFYNSNYVPANIFIDASTDGVHWTRAAHANRNSFSGDIALHAPAQFIRVTMTGKPHTGYPLIREISWLPFVEKPGAFATPGANDAFYYASKAFDGDPDTWWAGAADAGAWDLYYHFEKPTRIQMFTVHLFNVNYFADAMTLSVSGDGLTWTPVGRLGPGPNASPFDASVYVGASVTYLRLSMTGRMPSGAPLIKDVSWSLPTGASSGDSISTFYPAPNAFDDNPSSWWVGSETMDSWSLFYTFDAPVVLERVTVTYYAKSHAPQNTAVFVSDDGYAWSFMGSFAISASASVAVGRTARYVRLSMSGTPAVGYPVLRDVALVAN